MNHEGKIGPRINDVVDEILDMNWIYDTVSLLFLIKVRKKSSVTPITI